MTRVTVIVPTYNRVASLAEALDALIHQSVSDYEIIVVDDGSTDDTKNLLEDYRMMYDHLDFIRQKNQGPAAARNAALKMSQGSIIAFTDDDCVVDKDWVATIVEEFERNPEVLALQGRTSTDRPRVTPFTHQIDNEHGFDTIPTCNAAYRKSILEAVGGFDQSFPFPHNEDADLAWRVRELGEVKFVKNMHVYHPPRVDTFKKVASRMKILESEFLLYHKNKSLYKKYRAKSPWYLIYKRVMIDTHWYYLKSRFKFYRKPMLMLRGIMLSLWWWADLIRLYPKFKAADTLYQKEKVGVKS